MSDVTPTKTVGLRMRWAKERGYPMQVVDNKLQAKIGGSWVYLATLTEKK